MKSRIRKWMTMVGMVCMLLTVFGVSSNNGIGMCGEAIEFQLMEL